MKKSKYLVLSSFYFDFNDDLTEIKEIKALFENQNILDIFRFDKIKSIKKSQFMKKKLNFIYLSKNIEKIENEAFDKNQIEILDLSNCINLKFIESWSFWNNQIKQLKLPKNIREISRDTFAYNQIEILDLSNCINLKVINENAFKKNPLNEIKILDNINIEYYKYLKNDLWNKFVKYYNDNKMKSGDYKLENNEWKWYPL